MSNQVLRKNYSDASQRDQLRLLDIKWSTLSESTIPNVQTTIFRKIRSENKIESNVNYDDLCGPWVYSANPFYNRYVEPPNPTLCIWKYFTEEDVLYLRKHQENKDAIRIFFENKLPIAAAGTNNTVFTNLLWEFFKFARLNLFTEKSMSACLGIVYLTHTFFLSYPWLTAKQVHEFFYETVLLHVILYPPESLEVFTVTECKLLFKLFHKVYIGNLVLIHLLCHPSYHFTLRLKLPKNSTASDS